MLLTFVFSSSDNIWFYLMAGACGGVYLFYRGFRTLERERLIRNTPASKIRSASIGLVEVSGLAVGPYTIPAPISALPCYYYRTTAWQWQQRGKNSEWVKVADESLHLPFFLDDNTGRVLVDPRGAEMDIHRDFHQEFSNSFFSTSLGVPANVSSFLARHGVSDDKKTKIEEYCIKPKNALFILGTLAQNPGLELKPVPVESLPANQNVLQAKLPNLMNGMFAGALTPRTGVVTMTQQEVVRLSTSTTPANAGDMTQQGKIAAALTKAGITNPAAWAAAGLVGTGAQVSVSPGNGAAAATGLAVEEFDPHPPTVLMKGTHNPDFFISWRSQKEIVQAMYWKSAAMIWGGPALTLVCVYFLAQHFGWL
ncbi:MAG: E3 ubiquitin ligase family protein [Acidobacteriia bacterium]|nr:E3 ubiquitin ligase family protein [Terriglobia bacterium]